MQQVEGNAEEVKKIKTISIKKLLQCSPLFHSDGTSDIYFEM